MKQQNGNSVLFRYTFTNYAIDGVQINPRCEIDFTLDQIRTAVSVVSEGGWKEPRGPGAPVVNTWKRHHPQRVLEWAESVKTDEEFVEPAQNQWRSWHDIIDTSLASWQFHRCTCGLCNRPYFPGDIRKARHEEQTAPLAGWYGWWCFCPKEHMLFTICEAVS